MDEKVKAVKKNPDAASGSAEIYRTRSQARSNMINFGRFAFSAVRDGFFFKATTLQVRVVICQASFLM
jgi:hypothetical protein